MNWILVGTLLGSIITSQHDSREACEGRAVLLKEKNANVKCIEQSITTFSTHSCSGVVCYTK